MTIQRRAMVLLFCAALAACIGADEPHAPAGIGGSMFVFGPGQANADKIVFVCDASGSMLYKYQTLRRQLFKAVSGLKPTQSFNLVFMLEQGRLLLSPRLLKATPEDQLAADDFLEKKVTPRGESHPIPALEAAFAQNPQVIFLLTDGDFPDNAATLKRATELNAKHQVQVNTIAFMGEADTDTDFVAILKAISKDSGGIYRKVNVKDLGD